MRIAITGATGNVGTALVRRLVADPRVESIVGIARRRPRWSPEKTEWVTADIAFDDLVPAFTGADAVVHLAWMIQPARDPERMRATNVAGSHHVMTAAAACGVATLVHASSVGAYGARTSTAPVDESWPTTGIPTSEYSRQKAEVERALDTFEARHRGVRVVRLRTSIVMRHSVGAEIDRLFLPAWLPRRLLTPDRLRVLPVPRGLALQVVHSDDAASAYAAALFAEERGAFNVAGVPTLDAATLSTALDARAVEVAPAVMRTAVDVAFRSHLQPTPVGWFDLAAQVPLLDTGRARSVLGWAPEHDAGATLRDALFGIAEHAGEPTAPLTADSGAR